MESRDNKASPNTVAIASILVPGLGYWFIGQRWRGLLTGGGIIALFLLGIFFAGVRVINVPGYEDGYAKYIERRVSGNELQSWATTQPYIEVRPAGTDTAYRRQYAVKRLVAGSVREEITMEPPQSKQWILLDRPMSVIGDNLWFLGQMLTGPLCAVAGYISIEAAQAGVQKSVGRLADIGSLYTAVAGMLNLLVIIDSTARAGGKERR